MMNAKKYVDAHTMITKVSTVIAAFAMVLATLGSADAYSTRDCDRPTDLRIYLTLKTNPIHNNFTRYLTFIEMTGSERSVADSFMKSSRLVYEDHVTADGLATLQTLADHNKRSYWDIMYFENHRGSASLEIESLKVEIHYDNTVLGIETWAIIAYTLNRELDSGHDSFRVPSKRGRRVYARDSFGGSLSEYYALPPALARSKTFKIPITTSNFTMLSRTRDDSTVSIRAVRSGYAMMMVEWDDQFGEAHTSNGPRNINFSKVDVLDLE